MSKPTCSLLILSCDKYSDLWSACLTLHGRYWRDCPFPIRLASETLPVETRTLPGVRPILTGRVPWSDGLLGALAEIDSEYVLLMLDDFFLHSQVDTDRVLSLLAEVDAASAAYLRLVPEPRPRGSVLPGGRVAVHDAQDGYRTSLQAAFWRKSSLNQLLVLGESPWQFEHEGSRRSASTSGVFLSSLRHELPYVDVLERGRWLPRGLTLCKREGLPVNLGVRPAISLRDRLRRARMKLASRAVDAIPIQARRWIRNQR